jgi:hypothetical protein
MTGNESMRILRPLVVVMLLLSGLVSLGAPSASAYPPPSPPVSVSPSTGLAKGDVVLVSAAGLRPHRSLEVIQCDHFTPNADAETEPGNCLPTATISADGSGRVRVRVALKDPVFYDVPAGDDQQVYCRADHCRIFLAWTDLHGVEHALQSPELKFTGSPATLTVTPSTNLRTTQWVKVAGTAFGAEGHTLKIREQSCYHINQGSGCFGDLPFTWTKVRSDGTFSVSYQVRRFLPAADWPGTTPGFMDCTDFGEALGDCQITVAVLNSRGQRDDTFGISSIGDPRGSLEFATP